MILYYGLRGMQPVHAHTLTQTHVHVRSSIRFRFRKSILLFAKWHRTAFSRVKLDESALCRHGSNRLASFISLSLHTLPWHSPLAQRWIIRTVLCCVQRVQLGLNSFLFFFFFFHHLVVRAAAHSALLRTIFLRIGIPLTKNFIARGLEQIANQSKTQ